MNHLEEAVKILENLISRTPTGELRNSLTDVNILIHASIEEPESTFTVLCSDGLVLSDVYCICNDHEGVNPKCLLHGKQ